ncbi:MAG: hypothetical protein ACKVTZ_22750 [Bacteroidia bacterium]
MKKSLIFFVFSLICCVLSFAQTEKLTGKLIKKRWTKTIESYCAGGSDYYVLEVSENEATTLDFSQYKFEKKVNKYLNRKVEVQGTWVKEEKKAADPMMQQPTSAPLCERFVVTKMIVKK